MRYIKVKTMPRAVWGVFWAFLIVSAGNYVSQFMTLYLNGILGLEAGFSGMIASLAGIAAVPGIILGGKLSDTWGVKKAFFIFQIMAVAVTVVIIFVENKTVTPIMIILNSAFINAIYPVCNAAIFEATDEENRSDAVALFLVGMYVGYMLSDLGCAIGFVNHYRILYIEEVILKVLSIGIFLCFAGTETKKEEKAYIKKDTQVQEKKKEGLMMILIKNPALFLFSICCCLFSIVHTQSAYSLPIQLHYKFGEMGSSYYGIIMMLNAFFIAAGTRFINKMAKGRDTLMVVLTATVLVGCGMGILVLNWGLPLYIISTVLWSSSYILELPFATTYIGNYAPKGMNGAFSAWIKMVTSAGYALSPVLFGYIIKQMGIHKVWWFCILFTVINVAVLVGIKTKETLSS
ncbi:MFS transporter [[Clostridium] polysaccharolyticum]|uniref:Predicted arabinose efflux permease, MFS family n=1 Tax=[Clostridium] polysaccharolyticum TaxID=29364 RepID=A0A1I0D6Z3_9FIRM|nr:MFS transporter [[Clostridium] polysaccharolyticum]SET27979.1 Predicted arabinose efflux permease, MFS family [[Clostridium] polysaccharolyticum]